MEIIRVYSDLHNDSTRRAGLGDWYDIPKTMNEKDTILILAGDIDDEIYYLCGFLDSLVDRFKYVILVNGNHEYYRYDMEYVSDRLYEVHLRHENFILLDNEMFETDNYIFVGSTLWFDVPLSNNAAVDVALNYLNDFRFIKVNETGEKLDMELARSFNKNAKWMFGEAGKYQRSRNTGKKLVAISHHCPTMELVRPEFAGDPFNHVFHNMGMEETISLYDYWIYGHNHDTVDVEIEGCNLLSNALGYYLRHKSEYEVPDFVQNGLVLFDERLYGVE